MTTMNSIASCVLTRREYLSAVVGFLKPENSHTISHVPHSMYSRQTYQHLLQIVPKFLVVCEAVEYTRLSHVRRR